MRKTRQKHCSKFSKPKLHEVLVARADAWDKQIEEDIKAGRLDHLAEKALEDLRAGRCKRSIKPLLSFGHIIEDYPKGFNDLQMKSLSC